MGEHEGRIRSIRSAVRHRAYATELVEAVPAVAVALLADDLAFVVERLDEATAQLERTRDELGARERECARLRGEVLAWRHALNGEQRAA